MAIFKNAQTAVDKAQSIVTEWEAKAAAARAEAVRIDAEAGAAILADESAAERITVQVQSQERKARAYDQAAEEARRKLHAAQREAFEVEAREEDKQAAAARKKGEAHEAKVMALRDQLQELDGCGWERGPITDGITGAVVGTQTGKGAEYDFQVLRHNTRAAIIRYFMATGKMPRDWHDLNTELGTNFTTLSSPISNIEGAFPDSVTAARDAGLSFVGA